MTERDPAGKAPETLISRLRTGRARTALELVVMAALLLGVMAWRERDLLAPGESPAPTFTLAALDGTPVSLSALRGKTVLVHFWATWCGVCRMGEGELKATYEGLGPDAAMIAIADPSDDLDTLRAYVTAHDLRYPVVLGTPQVMQAFRVRALPTDYVVGKDGMIRGRAVGLSSRLGLRLRMWRAR